VPDAGGATPRLAGKVAIVTGGGAGLGRAHALTLAGLGAAVVVNDLGPSADAVVAQIEAEGGRAAANHASVSEWKGSKELVDQAVDTFGDLHILVNNAGVLRDKMSFNMDEDEWDLVVDVHLKGHFCPSRHAGAYWRTQAKAAGDHPPGRRIISTTSEAGLFGNAGQANYSAAKAGIVGLTWVLAREYERWGVTANVIAPRARTQMTEQFEFFQAPASGFDRFDPANVSRLVAWLASDEAAGVSGQIFIVMGGDVHLVKGFEIVSSLHKDEAWTVDELIGAAPALFGDRPSGVPPFGGAA
jgi:NAD(P)-dependent dehydrogenase (short-subunit alcohol dehydrogenase family)